MYLAISPALPNLEEVTIATCLKPGAIFPVMRDTTKQAHLGGFDQLTGL